jgi:hypothetical protein
MRLAGAAVLLATAAALLPASPALAAPTWLAPVDASPPGEEAFDPDVAIAPGGDAIAVWAAREGEGSAIRAAIRPPGGPWGAPLSVSAPGSEAFAPTATIDGAGDATVVWEDEATGETDVEAASLVAGGGWAPARKIGSVGEAVEEPPVLAADAAGDATVVWARGDGPDSTVETTTRPVGGNWSSPAPLSGPGEEAFEPRIAVDARGDAAAVWRRGEGLEVIESAERPAGGGWDGPTLVSAAGEEDVFPQVGLDAGGDATVIWERTDAATFVIREADRLAAAPWSTPHRISPQGFDAFVPTLAVDPGDDATAAWGLRPSPSEVLTGVASRTGAGGWSEPTTISPGGGNAVEQDVGLDAAGDATVAWTEGVGKNSTIDAATRHAAAGTWDAPVAFPTPGGFNDGTRLAVDQDGDALVVWEFTDSGGTEHRIRSAAYDAVGPALRSLSIPGAGTAAQPLSFSVAPLDAISPVVATTWSFGDGGSAATAAATHAYSSPGAYTVTVTAVDAAGNTSSASGQVIVAAAAPVPLPARPKPRKVQVRLNCPKGAGRSGCRIAVQAVDARPRQVKGKGGKSHLVAPKPESAVARAKVAAGRSTLLTLVAKARYATKLGRAAKILVRESTTVGGKTHTSYRQLKVVR